MNQEAIRELKEKLHDKALFPHDDSYEAYRQIWNGAVRVQPGVIVLPFSVEDVQATVRIADKYEIPLSVRGGGHDWAGRALNSGGIVINMRTLNNIQVDQHARTAVVQGGTIVRELIEAIEPLGLLAVTGTVGVVGFAGLTLGGGYGLLSPTYGLAIDNLLSAEVVLSDGSLVLAGKEENPDLFWAIKGGGGNFGVVTSMTVRLHPAKPFLAGMMLFPWSEAGKVLKGYGEIISSAPDELSMLAGVIPAPDGSPVLFLLPAWYGDPTKGERYIDQIRDLGNPFLVQVAPTKYADLLSFFDPHIVNGRHYALQTRWLAEMNGDAASAVIKACENRSSPLSAINIHHFHGASARVSLSDTAFGLRKPHFMIEIIAVWGPGDAENSPIHHQWASSLSEALAKYAFPGGYANILGPDELEQIDHAFDGNSERLLKAKQVYDPGNRFSGFALPR